MQDLLLFTCCLIVKLQEECYLIVVALCMRGVWRLIANEHVIEIKPCKGGNRASVIR